MFPQILDFLPQDPGSATLIVALVGSLLGFAFWLMGSRFSQPVIAWMAVAIGTAVGMKLPAWYGWNIDPMEPAVAGAVLLGISGFVLHSAWIGIGLGLVLSSWGFLAIWTTLANGADWKWPAFTHNTLLPKYLMDLWNMLPEPVQRYYPFVAVGAMLCGIMVAILWPRLGMSVMWSAAGTSMLITLGAMAIQRLLPTALERMPRQTLPQWSALVVMIGLGAILQWRYLQPATPGGSGEPTPMKKSPKSKE